MNLCLFPRVLVTISFPANIGVSTKKTCLFSNDILCGGGNVIQYVHDIPNLIAMRSGRGRCLWWFQASWTPRHLSRTGCRGDEISMKADGSEKSQPAYLYTIITLHSTMHHGIGHVQPFISAPHVRRICARWKKMAMQANNHLV